MGISRCSCLAGLQGGRRPVLQPEGDGARRGASSAGRRFSVSSGRAVAARAEDVLDSLPPRAGTYVAGQAASGPTQTWASPVPRAHATNGATSAIPSEKYVLLDLDGELRRHDMLSKVRPSERAKFEVEQLLRSPGSLPQPLGHHEREETIRRLLPTATHKLLEQLPADLVQAEGEDGVNLRRRLARGATVVFFTAGYAGKRFVFERACELGIKTVIIEHPDSWAKSLVEEGIIAKFIPVDMNRSADEILEESLEIIKGLGIDGVTGEADAVCTVVELSMPLVARICEEMGLPGPRPECVDAARDKHRTRAALEKAGLPTPRNFLIHGEGDVEAAADHVGFPAVLKPISGAASLGVKKVVERADLLQAYREVAAELSSLVVVSGALEQASSSGKGVSADKVVDMTVLFEQYLDGQEVDVDLVVSEGQWRYASVSDNGPTIEPYFNETWGVCPSLLPLDKQRELKDLALKSVEALGFWSGVFHVELKYTSTGPQLIEVNARMGGGPVCEVNKRVWGVDLVEETLFCALGIPTRPYVPKEPMTHDAYYLVPALSSGIVKAMPSFEDMGRKEGVIWARPLVKVGERIVGAEEGIPTWVYVVLVSKPSSKEALDFVCKLVAENQVVV